MKKVLRLAYLLIAIVFFAACNDNDENTLTTGELTVNLDGLEELGSNFVYEGWLIVDGNPVSLDISADYTTIPNHTNDGGLGGPIGGATGAGVNGCAHNSLKFWDASTGECPCPRSVLSPGPRWGRR